METCASTIRGRGIQFITNYEFVRADTLRLVRRAKHDPVIKVGDSASISRSEIAEIISFLRSKGITVDPVNEKEQQNALVHNVILALADRGWLNDDGREIAKKIRQANGASQKAVDGKSRMGTSA